MFVCTTCKTSVPGQTPGRSLINAAEALLSEHAGAVVSIKGVECLSVCKRPCTIALSGHGKWTYVVGDVHPAEHAGDHVAMSLKYAASEDGIVPWRERPEIFRRNMIARVPPLCQA